MASEAVTDEATVTIYAITGPTGRYVGSTTQRWTQRRAEHLSRLRKGIHRNRALQSAFNRHGAQAFTFSVIEVVPARERTRAEQRAINAGPSALNVLSSRGLRL